MHAGCVFVVGIQMSRTWISGSFESVWQNACVHRLDLGLYSHPKEFLGNGVRTLVNFKGKIPSTRKIFPRGGLNTRRCIKQDSEPNTLPASYSSPLLFNCTDAGDCCDNPRALDTWKNSDVAWVVITVILWESCWLEGSPLSAMKLPSVHGICSVCVGTLVSHTV